MTENSQKIRNQVQRMPDSDVFPLEVWQYMSATSYEVKGSGWEGDKKITVILCRQSELL